MATKIDGFDATWRPTGKDGDPDMLGMTMKEVQQWKTHFIKRRKDLMKAQ